MHKINLTVEYLIGESVFYKTDKDQIEYMVVGYTFNSNKNIYYQLSNSTSTQIASSIELSDKKDIIKMTSN